jgi:hypothetical protein
MWIPWYVKKFIPKSTKVVYPHPTENLLKDNEIFLEPRGMIKVWPF